jgi:hypothetical protein
MRGCKTAVRIWNKFNCPFADSWYQNNFTFLFAEQTIDSFPELITHSFLRKNIDEKNRKP